ncbi:MAG: response regulator [Anaerolineae bacterium]|nr:response regulator [Anaerolineae bacterium]
MTVSNKPENSLPRSAITLLAFAAIVLVYAAWLFAFLLAMPTDGIGGVAVAGGILVNQQPPEGSSFDAEDLIVEVGGESIAEHAYTPGFWSRLFAESSGYQSRIYTVLHGGRPVENYFRWRQPSLGWFLSRTWSFIVLGLIFTFSGAFIVWRRGSDVVARLLALTLILEGANLFNNMVFASGVNTGLMVAWLTTPIDLLSFGLVFSTLFQCFCFFPEPKALGRRFGRRLYLVHLLNPFVGVVGGLIWAVLLPEARGTPLAIRATMLSSLYLICGIELVWSIVHIVHTYRTTRTPGTRNQIRWLIWGLVMGTAPWLLLYNLMFVLTGQPLLPLSVTIFPLVLLPLSLIFSIARYGLMKIDTIINRSLVYGVLTAVLIVINLVAATLLNRVLSGGGIGQSEMVTIVVSTLITIVLIGAVRDRLQRWIDRIFYRERLNFENLLKEMGERLSTTIVFDNLVTLLTEFIPASLKLDRAFLFTLGDSVARPSVLAFVPHPDYPLLFERDNAIVEWLQSTLRPLSVSQFRHPTSELAQALIPLAEAGIEVCLPLRRGAKLIGIYALGSKAAGELYADHELETLTLLGHQIAAALENTRLYREVEAYNRTLESQVQGRTAELRTANKKLADTAWDLAEQRARLDAILQNIADGLVVTDLDDQIVLTNAVLEEIVGADTAALKNSPLQRAFSGEGLIDVVQRARMLALPSCSGEVTSWTGRVYQASASALVQGRTVIGVVTVLRDITHEVEVDRMKTNFISTVSHELRTPLTSVLGFAKLIQRSFEENIVSKIEAGDRKGQRAVERISRNLEIIASESQRLTRLINDVLDIAKMEAGKVEWHLAETKLVDVIDNAVEATVGMIGDKPLCVHVEVPSDLPALTVDADRIVQVVTNLLSNAIKFAAQGDIRIRAWGLEPGDNIEPQGAREPNVRIDLPAKVPMIAVSVTDPGIGIHEQDLPKVFDRFKQVGDVLTGRPRGTGLGLSICREIVDYHGGRIWVESTLGVGSRFVFTLPVERAESFGASASRPAAQAGVPLGESAPYRGEEETYPGLASLPMMCVDEIREHVAAILPPAILPPAALSIDRPVDQTQAQQQNRRTILVVDDEPAIRLLLNQELSDAGYMVLEASEGLTAVETARIEQPDLILLDVMMPGLSGFDVTSVLKSDERTAHIPILILSIIEDRERGFRLGADDYLTKPIRTDQLLNSISSLLSASEKERRVLVVHQDESVVEAITRVLRQHGFEVTAAYDPRGAIETAQKIKPSLVILNSMLSQLDDYQMLKALNYTNINAQVDILVLASSDEQVIDDVADVID